MFIYYVGSAHYEYECTKYMHVYLHLNMDKYTVYTVVWSSDIAENVFYAISSECFASFNEHQNFILSHFEDF